MWADGTIDIPQDLGSFISLGTSSGTNGDVAKGVNLSNCKVDQSNTRSISGTTNYFTIGNTGSSSVATFNVTVSSAADFIFRFKSGAENCSATMTLSLRNSSNTVVWSKTDEAINSTGSWDLTQLHCFNLGNLAADSYTLTLSITANTGFFAGNWGDFCFHTASKVPLPTSTDPYLNMVEGTFINTNYNNDNVINNIRPDGYIDNLVFYNSTEGYYMFNFKNSESNYGYADAQIKLNVYDAFTGTVEGEYTIDASTSSATNKEPISGRLTTGWKKIRITFVSTTAKSEETGETMKYLFNFANAYFTAINDVFPMYGTAVLDMSKGSMTSSSYPCYSSSSGTNNEISFIYNGGYADKFYVLINGDETAYYDLRTVTSNYNNKGGTFKVTITDVETNTIEVNAQESSEITSNNQNIIMPLSVALKPGLKKIRFDFVKDGESDWLYNIKDVSFYKRSLNENYDYTPVAAENVDVVLTRTINAGKWSTIVLPFDMTEEQVTEKFGANVKLAQFTAYNSATKEVTMSAATAMNANEPYMIKVAEGQYNSPVTINGVTIVEPATSAAKTYSPITFQGVYESGNIKAGDYYVKNNQLFKATGTQTIKPFRAYFTGVPAEARLMFFDDETTSIANVDVKANDNFDANAPIFNLAGQRVGKNYKGVVIQNGKKYILK